MSTVAEHYREKAHDGRAVILGTDANPFLWVTRPLRDHEVYALCFFLKDSILLIEGTTLLESLNDHVYWTISHIGGGRH